MPFELARYLKLRPYAYHVTDARNLASLRRTSRLEPAGALITRSGRSDLAGRRRSDPMPVEIDGSVVVLKDQRPLRASNMSLPSGWTEGVLVDFLDRHVFFWPGSEEGPIRSGARLLDAYSADAPLVLRVPTRDLLTSNPDVEPLFCPFNSGAPRMNSGKPVPRGPDLFQPAARFPREARDVVELVFRGSVTLLSTCTTMTGSGRWTALSDARRPGLEPAPTFVAAIPVLPSSDIARSVAFAVERLGFEAIRCEREVYGIVRRDGVTLHFWPCDDRRIAEASGCRIVVDDIDGLHAGCASHGIVHPNGGLRDTPWGTREFAVLDPDGNLITFQRASG